MATTISLNNDSAKRTFAGSSERRKAQNRASQKTYREKRKKLMQELERRAAEAHVELASLTTSSKLGDIPRVSCNGNISRSLTVLEGTLATISKPDIATQDQSLKDPDLCPRVSVERQSFSQSNPPKRFSTFFPYDMSDPYFHSRRQVGSIEDSEEENPTDSNILNVTFTPATSFTTPSQDYSSPYLANVYVNNLCVARDLSFISGFHLNALQIGVHPHQICGDSESRFYRPGFASNPLKDKLVKSIKHSFKNLTSDLRPSEAQITISHNPYIDVIPFPTVRERMLRLTISAGSPNPQFDEDDLCNDLVKGGLVCWGYVGASRHGGVESGAGGHPWERGSWEAMEWFLEKWRMILGDEDEEGGLWRISRGWRALRGDDIVV